MVCVLLPVPWDHHQGVRRVSSRSMPCVGRDQPEATDCWQDFPGGLLLYNCIVNYRRAAGVSLAQRGTDLLNMLNQDATGLLTRDEDIDRASRSMKAIAHPLRLKILCTLGNQEISVQDIVERVGTSQSNISQHLAILRDKGILTARKDANRVFYKVGDSRTLRLISMMREVFCNYAG